MDKEKLSWPFLSFSNTKDGTKRAKKGKKHDRAEQSIHLYARPDTKEQLLAFFTSVLGLEVSAAAKAYISSPEPMYVVTFSNDARLSVEFTDDALSDQQAQRGAWLELRTDDAVGLQQKVQAFGLKRVVHPFTPFFYIQAPGGQVFRIVESNAR